MASLERPVPDDETNDAERDDGGRVRLSEADGERDRTAYRQYLAMRRPSVPRVSARFDEGRGRQLSR